MFNEALFDITLWSVWLLTCGERSFIRPCLVRQLDSFEISTLKTIFANSYFFIISQVRELTLVVWASSADSHSAFSAVMLTQREFIEKLLTDEAVGDLRIHPKRALSFLNCVHPIIKAFPDYLNPIKDKPKFLLFALNFKCERLRYIILCNIQIFAITSVNGVYLLQANCFLFHIAKVSICVGLIVK